MASNSPHISAAAALIFSAPLSAITVSAPEIVSRSPSGNPAGGFCGLPRFSATARYLAFSCLAGDLLPGDDNDRSDIYLLDRNSGVTRRVSLNAANAEQRNHADLGLPSADGRQVVFRGEGEFHPDVGYVPPAPDHTTANVFLRDMVAPSTTLLNRAADGSGNPEGRGAFLRDASFTRTEVLFTSSGHYLGDLDTLPPMIDELFVRNWTTGFVERVNARPDGGQSGSTVSRAALSPDGRYVVFASDASDMTNDNPLGHTQLFERDRITHTTRRLTRPWNGAEFASSPSFGDEPKITSDGRYVLFQGGGLAPFTSDDNPFVRDVFLLDRITGTIELISDTVSGAVTDGSTFAADMSADGRIVAWFTRATNTLDTPTPQGGIYVKDRQTGQTIHVTDTLGDPRPYSSEIDLSPDGRSLAFSWPLTNYPDPNFNGQVVVFTTRLGFGPAPGMTVTVPAQSRWSGSALTALLLTAAMLAYQRSRRDKQHRWPAP